MNRAPLSEDDSWESDTVWKLLDEALPVAAGPRFADKVMRAVKLDEAPAPWWKRFALPISLGGLTAATVAVALAVHITMAPVPSSNHSAVVNKPTAESFDAVQDITDSEALVTAADHLDRYSDTELVSLITY